MVKRLLGLCAAALLAGGLILVAFPEASLAAHSGASAQRECRASVGRPIVRACVRSKLQHVGGKPHHHVVSCRADASPAVRACVERTVPHIVAHCRETVGRPMVRACVQKRIQSEGGSPRLFVEGCRLSISWAVRTCVSRTALASPAALGR
jgi:hypothetical protein